MTHAIYNDRVTTQPTHEPVTLEEVKTFLRVSHGGDDALLTTTIKAARLWLEDYQGRAFITQTRTVTADGWPLNCRGEIDLFRAPVASITSITYRDTGDTSTVWSSSYYQVDAYGLPPRVLPKVNQTYPALYDRYDAVVIVYVAGQVTDDVPRSIKEALKRVVRAMYSGCDPASDCDCVAWSDRDKVRWAS